MIEGCDGFSRLCNRTQERELSMKYNEVMEDKYKSLLIFMQCALNYEDRHYFQLNENRKLKDENDYLHQLKLYYYNSLLYSSENVLKSIKNFISQPNDKNFILAALSMRNEIWERKNKLTYEQISLSQKND